jgi:hypothetical protein
MTPVGERGKNVLLETGKSCRWGACSESPSSSQKQAMPPASFPAIARDEPLRPHYSRWCALPLNSLALAAPPRLQTAPLLRPASSEHLVQAHLPLCGPWLSI